MRWKTSPTLPWPAACASAPPAPPPTLGFAIIAPKVCKLIRGTDTCGVHNLHGMPGLLGGLFGIAITGNVGVQVGAVVATVVVGLVLGRVCGAILGLFGTKEVPYSDEGDFLLEEE